MSRYTCTTENRGLHHISQHTANKPEEAFMDHIQSLPFAEGINPIGDELYWIQNIASGKIVVTLRSLKGCPQVWKWYEGENYPFPYTSYIINTVTDN